jgi:glycosyltransferase involved in cell wall biosynthesis
VLVVDLYAPFQLEVLEHSRSLDRSARRAAVARGLDVVNEQLRRGDYFLCASERQRDFWIGQLTGVGRVNEVVSDASPDLAALVAVVPFGVPDAPPERRGRGIRGVVPGISTGDDVLVWGGGIYDWFDPFTLLHAVASLRDARPQLRLYFVGARHPNPAVAETGTARRARALSDELGLTDRHVFFGDWVAYDERADVLLDADLAVSTHHDHVETRYSFRTRALDAFWAGLPVITTAGDSIADLVAASGAGAVVPVGDPSALAGAIDSLLTDASARAAAASAARGLADDYRWSTGLAPLRAFCAEPRKSPDRQDAAVAAAIDRGRDLAPSTSPFSTALGHVRRREWAPLWHKTRARVAGRG